MERPWNEEERAQAECKDDKRRMRHVMDTVCNMVLARREMVSIMAKDC